MAYKDIFLNNIHELSCLCIWKKACIHPICMFSTIPPTPIVILSSPKRNKEWQMYIKVEMITGFCFNKILK